MNTSLYALNRDGTRHCSVSPSASSIMASPVIDPTTKTVYVLDVANTLAAYGQNCQPKWKRGISVATGGESSPAVAPNGTIYAIAGYEQRLRAFNPNGTPKCSFRITDQGIVATPAVGADGTVFVGADGLYALRPDCTKKWKFGDPLFSSASAVIDGDGTVFWSDGDGEYALNPNRTVQWHLAVGWGSSSGLDPSAAIGAGRTLYLGDGGFTGPTRLRAIAP